MIIITGSVLAKPETIERVKQLGLEHTRRSRKEPGCLSHDVYTNVEEPLRVFFFETWADREAVAAHFAVPASLAFVKAAGELSDGPPSIQIYNAEVAPR